MASAFAYALSYGRLMIDQPSALHDEVAPRVRPAVRQVSGYADAVNVRWNR
jgi:hypothetical protein